MSPGDQAFARFARAYADQALPIGEGQTISQPYMVAIMTEALSLGGGERVLEIGTGSGYQTAMLCAASRSALTVAAKPIDRRSVATRTSARDRGFRVVSELSFSSEDRPLDQVGRRRVIVRPAALIVARLTGWLLIT